MPLRKERADDLCERGINGSSGKFSVAFIASQALLVCEALFSMIEELCKAVLLLCDCCWFASWVVKSRN